MDYFLESSFENNGNNFFFFLVETILKKKKNWNHFYFENFIEIIRNDHGYQYLNSDLKIPKTVLDPTRIFTKVKSIWDPYLHFIGAQFHSNTKDPVIWRKIHTKKILFLGHQMPQNWYKKCNKQISPMALAQMIKLLSINFCFSFLFLPRWQW